MASPLSLCQSAVRDVRLLRTFRRCRAPYGHLAPATPGRHLFTGSLSLDSVGSNRENASVLVGLPGLKPEERFELPRTFFKEEGIEDDHGQAKIVVAMSGGVDSSLTLALLHALAETDPEHTLPRTPFQPPLTLHRKPLHLSAVFMRNWSPLQSEDQDHLYPDTESSTPSRSKDADCSWEADYESVKRVCSHLGIPDDRVRMLDLSREYWLDVFEPAVGVWEGGGTPNPDVGCNREIKFGALMDRTLTTANTYLATGHYARVSRHYEDPPAHPHGSSKGDARVRSRLMRSRDPMKDQTYYLSSVPEEKLAKAIFPLASIPKPRVRQLARFYGLPTAEREESMGVCFIGERGRFGDFVSQYTSATSASPGHIVTSTGIILGTHNGLWHYTIGQRARIGGLDGRWFVSDKRKERNEVVVVPGSDHPDLQSASLTTQPDFSWIHADDPPSAIDSPAGLRAFARIRHRMIPVLCTVGRAAVQGPQATALKVEFDVPLTAVAPGQVIGLWAKDSARTEQEEQGDGQGIRSKDGDWCLGSGVIASPTSSPSAGFSEAVA